MGLGRAAPSAVTALQFYPSIHQSYICICVMRPKVAGGPGPCVSDALHTMSTACSQAQPWQSVVGVAQLLSTTVGADIRSTKLKSTYGVCQLRAAACIQEATLAVKEMPNGWSAQRL
jgi:hypothetical protein